MCEDVDIDQAVKGAMAAKFQTTGQDCLAANRIYVHHDIFDKFVKQFTKAVSALKVGNGMDLGTEMGPLMNAGAVKNALNRSKVPSARGFNCLLVGIFTRLVICFFNPPYWRQ